MIVFSSLQIRRGIRVLLDNATATVNPGQKVGLVGKNGCGKSTLLSLLKGEIAADGGSFTFPGNWALAWVNQETPALDVPAIEYVIDGDREFRQLEAELQAANDRNDGHAIATLHGKLDAIDAWTIRSRAASLLHGLGFSNEQLQSPVRDFSGGWRMRLNLAQALVCRSDLLLLDEPTNHLDLDMRQALTEALIDFEGALVVVSHDRHLLRSTTDDLYLVHDGQVEPFEGDLDDYQQWLVDLQRQESQQDAPEKESGGNSAQARKDQKRREAEFRTQTQPLRKQIAKLEQQMEKLGAELAAVEEQLADPALYDISRKAELTDCLQKQSQAKSALEETEMTWLDAQEQLEQLTQAFEA
ncbi:ATP-binding cassette domain-containing protein [Serratia marcescens]|uniref:ATP-binding cassette domain-containing protein n=1 Tax=Serratia marcescens TaxID=615 RepID=UPI000F7E3DCC|nr:ATP-binding cassette domain-containing protein [Serratia marcescens]RTF86593.1 ATP-binding cassette domain-containing protein [Serratia marcescens]RTG33448.1 ATP-binding cassette domain-containing protein [Serratia marcescens]